MYQNRVRKINPGLLVILIDQSEAMNVPMLNGNGTMADNIANEINQLIEALEYYYSYEDGYGNEVGAIRPIMLFVVGHGSGEAHIIQQEWICGGAHMVSPVAQGMPALPFAFDLVKEEVAYWTKMHSDLDDVVPLIINVTASGNMSNDIPMRAIIKDIMGIQMPDGNPILYNIHLVSKKEAPIIYFPNEEAQLPDTFSKLMYWSSSVINKALQSRAPKFFSKRSCNDGARLFVYNAQSLYEAFSFAVEYFCEHKPRYESLYK